MWPWPGTILEDKRAYFDITIMTSKCPFFDNGFCKNKNKCTQKHPPQDCDGEYEDLNTE